LPSADRPFWHVPASDAAHGMLVAFSMLHHIQRTKLWHLISMW
jgi:hypothetical protein